MKINLKRALVLFALLLVVVNLVACTRSRPAPAGTPAPTEAGAGPAGATSDAMSELVLFVTQTAMAAGIQPGAQTTPGVPGTTEGPILSTQIAVPNIEVPPVQPTLPPAEQQPTAIPTTAAPTQAPVVVPTATPGLPRTYTLEGGEFPFCIARRFNVNQIDLLTASGLSMNSRPGSGYQLTIPQNGRPFEGNRALAPHPTTYSVQSGDTLNSIACKYGDVDPSAIAFANSLTPPYTLSSGQSLQIP